MMQLDLFEDAVRTERLRQNQTHREANENWTLAEWVSVLMEEVGSFAKAVNQDERNRALQELIQVAAVCKAIWVYQFEGKEER